MLVINAQSVDSARIYKEAIVTANKWISNQDGEVRSRGVSLWELLLSYGVGVNEAQKMLALNKELSGDCKEKFAMLIAQHNK